MKIYEGSPKREDCRKKMLEKLEIQSLKNKGKEVRNLQAKWERCRRKKKQRKKEMTLGERER